MSLRQPTRRMKRPGSTYHTRSRVKRLRRERSKNDREEKTEDSKRLSYRARSKARVGGCEDLDSWSMTDVRAYMMDHKYHSEIYALDKLLENIKRRERFRLLDELENTSCLMPCLDFLTAKELTQLACCSRAYKKKIHEISLLRIARLTGDSQWRLPPKGSQKQPIMSYDPTTKISFKKVENLLIRQTTYTSHMYAGSTESDRRKRACIQDRPRVAEDAQKARFVYRGQEKGPDRVHQWVDVEDTTARWLEAQIIDVNGPMDLKTSVSVQGSLANKTQSFQLRTGFMFKFTEPVIMVHDTTDKWVEASVIGYRTWSPNCAQVRVTYHGWDKKYDEWIDVESYRLAPRPAFPPE
eukprot:1380872-Amorphochlora_amoeboformis.AAC.1